MSHDSPTHSTPGANQPADELFGAVYGQLRAIAQQRLNLESKGHTLQATALVNEAYLRITNGRSTPFQNRGHFFAIAAEAMRRILIDHARGKKAVKRGGGVRRDPISILDLAIDHDLDDVLALDEAISRLEKAEPKAADVVRLRFFAGLSGDETAEALGVSSRHVDSLWAYARAWLAREMEK